MSRECGLKVLKNLEGEIGNYEYRAGFPRVFDGIDEIFIVNGRLAKESEQKDGPYYVSNWVKDDDIFIINWVKDDDIFIIDDSDDKDIVYRIRDAEDVLHFMNGETDNLEIEEKEVFWC